MQGSTIAPQLILTGKGFMVRLIIIDCGFIYSGCIAYLIKIDYTGTAVLQPKDKETPSVV